MIGSCGYNFKSEKYAKVENKPELVKKACRLYREGKSAREVGECLGVSKNTILNWLKENNVPKRQKRKYSYEMAMQIGQKYESGYTANEIAKKYEMNVGNVKAILSHFGFDKDNKRIRIAQIDSDGNVVNVFNSLSDASKKLQVTVSALSRAYDTKATCKGYRWRTIGGNENEQNSISRKINRRS